MKFGIMGAGAVGCYYGAMLAIAGHSVTLVGRPGFVERVRAQGLLLEKSAQRQLVPVAASADSAVLAECDVVLFCVKSTDTEEAGKVMATHLGADATVVSFQNGLGNVERLEAALRREVVPAVLYVAAEIVELGHVRHHGRGDVIIGASRASAAIAEVLSSAGIPAKVSETVIVDLWGKLVVNCAYNALSAVSCLPYGALMKVEGVAEVMNDVFAECAAVAGTEGVTLPERMRAEVLKIAEAMPQQFSSTAQDLMRHKPTEIDYLNGYVVRKGRERGIPTPVNRALQIMVKLAETAGRG
jgi:2-dehydropantoate 2-reductase